MCKIGTVRKLQVNFQNTTPEFTNFDGDSGRINLAVFRKHYKIPAADIRAICKELGLEIIRELRVRNFEYRTPEEITEVPSHAAIKKTGVQIGLIAQEAQEVLPNIVKEETTGVLSVDPDNLTWYLINAVKELDAENTTLKEENATQQSLIDDLIARVTALEG